VKYVPEKWKDRAPRLIDLPDGGEAWMVEGQPLLRNGQNITGRGPIRFDVGSYYKPDGTPNDGAGPATQRLREQDEDGIDAEVLFPPVFATRFLEVGMALSPHFGFGEIRSPAPKPSTGTAGRAYASALTQRAGSHSPVFCMAQLMAAGVFDRFPDIRFYFAETNISWLPSTSYFMDDNHEIFSTAFGGRRMELTPSEYIALDKTFDGRT
jgi:hypothetical protein